MKAYLIKVYGQSHKPESFTINQQDQLFKFTRVQHQSETPSNTVHRMTRQRPEMEKEGLTFAFALAYAAAHAGSKLGS
jgi:hypothetical protein